MFRYPTYPNIWTSLDQQAVLVVKVPEDYQEISEGAYRELMEQRLAWMIWQETEDQGLEITQLLLAQFVQTTAPAQSLPELPETADPDEIAMWCQDWAQALVMGNEAVQEALNQVDLPALPLTTASSTYSTVLELHDPTHLSTWLAEVQP